MKRSELGYVVLGVLLAGIVGGLMGEVVGSFLPDGAAKTLIVSSFDIGFTESTLKIYSINVTLGIMFKFNFVSVLMMIFVLAYFRWWYL